MKEITININDYLSEGEIKEIVKEKFSSVIEDDVKNKIEVAIKYAFFELLPKEYVEKLPSLVEEKLRDIEINDFIGYPPSDYSTYREQNIEARRTINQAIRDNKEKIAEILLTRFSEMEDYDAKEILVQALRYK